MPPFPTAVPPAPSAAMPAHRKYRPFPRLALPDRRWPDGVIEAAPSWCSVDLRDGNQALFEPMEPARKLHLFQALVRIGFKEIEVGFPAASQTDFDFVRHLIDQNLIPPDVTIQVLTQAREALIERTFAALAGARRAVVHLYNSTSELQRRVVFGHDRERTLDLAVQGTTLVRRAAAACDAEVVFEYSPESFTGTEPDFAVAVCDAVVDAWGPTPNRKVIINLPATVEMAAPNTYADQIEWFCRTVAARDRIIVSIHPHNDRGTAVAAAELALAAGADRVEGTLFGNGERTGNVDIVTLALNLFSHGIDPGLDLSDLPGLVEVAERCTRLRVPPRHPYAGELVFTAFSGSHQDAIRKGMKAYRAGGGFWEVPYLPIDPADIGRIYEPIIRINSQSGKGGVAFLLESRLGADLPRDLQIEFAPLVQAHSERIGREVGPDELFALFEDSYLKPEPIGLAGYNALPAPAGSGVEQLAVTLQTPFGQRTITGSGKGCIDALAAALADRLRQPVIVHSFAEHALGSGADASAICFIRASVGNGPPRFGVGIDVSILTASLKAVLSAVNRSGAGLEGFARGPAAVPPGERLRA